MKNICFIAGVMMLLARAVFAADNLPKVLIMVDEKSLGTIATSEIESMAIAKLIEQKISVVDQDMVRANIKKNQSLLKSVGDARGAASLGLQFGAEVIITGEAVAKPSARRIADSNFRAYQATVALKAIKTDNSAVLCSVSDDASVPGIDDVAGSARALKSAGEKTITKLIPLMLEAWKKAASAPTEASTVKIGMTIGGVDQMWKLRETREKLKSMTTKISNLVQKSYTSGVAIFELESTISAEELAEEVVLNAPKGIKFQVLSITSGNIDIRLVTDPPPQANGGGQK